MQHYRQIETVARNINGRSDLLQITGQRWKLDAPCAQIDPDGFFPEKGHPPNKELVKICRTRCLVREDCFEAGVTEGHVFGVWGGESVYTLKRVRLQRKLAAEAEAASEDVA